MDCFKEYFVPRERRWHRALYLTACAPVASALVVNSRDTRSSGASCGVSSRPLGANILPHQPGLLMLKDVAVIHEGMLSSCRLIESDEKLGLVLYEHRVL